MLLPQYATYLLAIVYIHHIHTHTRRHISIIHLFNQNLCVKLFLFSWQEKGADDDDDDNDIVLFTI